MMDLLQGTPYLLDERSGSVLVQAAAALAADVEVFRAGGKLSEDTLARLRREWGFEQVYESAGIEGNTLTLNETQIAISRGITITGKPAEHSDEVINLHRALEFLERLAADTSPLTEQEIRQIHSLILDRHPEAGRYRAVDVAISGAEHRPPSSLHVGDHMRELVAWVASAAAVPTPLIAAVAHAWFVHIHPFRDGNGRTGRALMNLLFMRRGFPIVIIRRKDRRRYYEALEASDDGDLGPFLELLTERCKDSFGQINRARVAVEGVTLAMERVRAKEERRFRIWSDAIQLFSSTLADIATSAGDQDPSYAVDVRHYDSPSFDDFYRICQRDARGNTWLLRIDFERRGSKESVLLWVGYSSDQMVEDTGSEGPFPTIWLSGRNPAGYPPWVGAAELPGFPTEIREIGFDGGYYWCRRGDSHRARVDSFERPMILASGLVAELIDGWFAAPQP